VKREDIEEMKAYREITKELCGPLDEYMDDISEKEKKRVAKNREKYLEKKQRRKLYREHPELNPLWQWVDPETYQWKEGIDMDQVPYWAKGVVKARRADKGMREFNMISETVRQMGYERAWKASIETRKRQRRERRKSGKVLPP
jgi:hypothetical protein